MTYAKRKWLKVVTMKKMLKRKKLRKTNKNVESILNFKSVTLIVIFVRPDSEILWELRRHREDEVNECTLLFKIWIQGTKRIRHLCIPSSILNLDLGRSANTKCWVCKRDIYLFKREREMIFASGLIYQLHQQTHDARSFCYTKRIKTRKSNVHLIPKYSNFYSK